MSTLEKIACMQGRRDEVPNQALAKDLAAKQDRKGIQKIAANLSNKDKNIQADCLKVLYEIGYIKPELIAPYVGDFLHLLASRNNRLVWGGMIALSTVADLKPREIFEHLEQVTRAMETGSVITVDNAVKVLARVAAVDPEYNRRIFPRLIQHLQDCPPKQLAPHAESSLSAVNHTNKKEFMAVLSGRKDALAPAQAARIRKVVKAVESV